METRLPTANLPPEKRVLVAIFQRLLDCPETLELHYDPAKLLKGDAWFVVIDSLDGLRHMSVQATVNGVGSRRSAKLTWWHEESGHTGEVKYENSYWPNEYTGKGWVNRTRLSPFAAALWVRSAGIEWDPWPAQCPTPSEDYLRALAEELEAGEVNPVLLSNGRQFFNNNWGTSGPKRLDSGETPSFTLPDQWTN